MSRRWRLRTIHEQNQIKAEVRRMWVRPDWPGWHEAGRRFGVDHDTLRWHCDEAYAEKRRERGRRWRGSHARPKRGKEYFAETFGEPSHHTVTKPPLEDISARLAEIPEDTRSHAQRLTGDPIPGDDRRTRYG